MIANRRSKMLDDIIKKLKERGLDLPNSNALEVATLSRGTDHLVLLNRETIGEYNHKSKQLIVYEASPEV